MILQSTANLDLFGSPELLVSFETENYFFCFYKCFDTKGCIEYAYSDCIVKPNKDYDVSREYFSSSKLIKESWKYSDNLGINPVPIENLSAREIEELVIAHLVRRRLK